MMKACIITGGLIRIDVCTTRSQGLTISGFFISCHTMGKRKKILWAAGVAAVTGLFAAEMLTGSAGISAGDVWKALSGGSVPEQVRLIVTEIRLPKALTALLSGMAISVSGLLMQTLFRNPLAGPYVLGISSGASLGAAVCVLGTSASATLAGSQVLMSLGTAGAAWLGAAAVLGIIAMAGRRIGDITVILILGMMLGAGIDAVVQILQFLSDEQALKSYIIWTMGSMGSVSGPELWILAAATAAGTAVTAVSCKSLNLLLLGEGYAASMGADIGRTVDFAAGRNRYIGYLISLPTRSFKNMRVGLDCANGSASAIAKSVFDALGAKTYVINNEPDGTNINTNCGSTHIEVLQKFVKEKKLDVGFAYDGDADRCIAVDENGEVVDGDRIMYICGKYMKEQGVLKDDTIVTTVMSNLGLYKACDKAGIRYEKTAVGDKYVYENMTKNGFQLGGEQSGHIIFSKHATTGDGILTSLKVMEVILEKKASLAALASEVKIYPQLLQNLRVQDMDAVLNAPSVQKAIAEVEERLGTEGRVLVRKSGTEPLLRVMVEAQTDELCEENVLHIINAMKGV